MGEKSKDFIDNLHNVLVFAMDECIKTDWMKDADVNVGYAITDYFEDMADTVASIQKVSNYYNNYLVYDDSIFEYVLSRDINDIDVSTLTKDELLTLQKRIETALQYFEGPDVKINTSTFGYKKGD